MESINNDEIKIEETIAREQEKEENLLRECFEYEQDKSHLQAEALEQMYQENLRLRKEIEYVRAIEREKLERMKCKLETFKIKHEIVKGHVEAYETEVNAMREERDNALKLVNVNMCLKAEEFERKYKREVILTKALMKEKQEMKTKHENMCLKAKEFESKYKSDLILTKALIKEKQEMKTKHENMCLKAVELESKYKRELILKKAKQELEISYSTKGADAMQKESNNAIKFVNEKTTKKQVTSFICPISQEVMKDPQLTSDGFTYEAESIRRWFSTGKHTSPMTNLKLSHTNLVPNRALRSAIQELV